MDESPPFVVAMLALLAGNEEVAKQKVAELNEAEAVEVSSVCKELMWLSMWHARKLRVVRERSEVREILEEPPNIS